MGSLLPGSLLPEVKGEQEQNDSEEETKGYFARLERKRSLRHHDASDDAAFLPSELLERRRSLPLVEGATATPTSTPTNAEDHVAADDAPPQHPSPSAAFHSHLLTQSATLPRSSPRVLSRVSAPMCHGTDWTSELMSLGGQKISPVGSAPTTKLSSAWWSRMDSGALNRRPDVEVTHTRSGGDAAGFTPQHAITGQKMPPWMKAQSAEAHSTEAKEEKQK